MRGALRPRRLAAWEALHRVVAGSPVPEGVDWDAVADAARGGEVVGVVAGSHPELQARLDTSLRRQTLVDMSLELALDRIARAFAVAKVERVALLKGSVTGPTLYRPAWRRARRDVDLLVAEGDLVRAIDALAADGWRPDVDPARLAEGPRRARAWPMVLELPVGLMSCDLHRRLFDATGFAPDEGGILARATRAEGVALPVSSPEDTFLHTCLHIARAAFQEPLKAWVDLLMFLRWGRLDLDIVARRARSWGARAAVWGCLLVVGRWFGQPPPDRLMRAVAPALPLRAALRALLSGTGPDPLRWPLERRAAAGMTALLVRDDLRTRAAYLHALLATRLPA